MGFTYNEEFPCKVPAKRMFKVMITESHIHIPKIVPDGIKSIQYVKGEGCAVGSIKETKFAEGGHLKCMKHRMDAIDEEKFYCKYTLIEGDVIFDTIESVEYELKLEPAGNGCVCKVKSVYHAKAGVEIKEEEVKKGKEKALGLYKAIEEYLLAHPDVCCA